MMKNQPSGKGTSIRPRGLQLCLRDQALVDGTVFAADGTHLPTCLGNRKGWVNLTSVHFRNTGEKLPHIAVQTNRILWAASPSQEIPLMPVSQGASPRLVEMQLEGGVVLRGDLMLAQNQRLSDYLGAFGDFIPLRDARQLPSGNVIGDVAVNREAIERLREIELDGTTNEVAAGLAADTRIGPADANAADLAVAGAIASTDPVAGTI
ncbi:MAG: hypothetical protein WEE89_09620, partial [Gemmatimonadota bacterium]